MKTEIVITIVAVFILGFSIGYMIGFRDGKTFVKTVLNELYGKFGTVDTSSLYSTEKSHAKD